MTLHEAAKLGDVEELKRLIAAGADVNIVDEEWMCTPLGVAASHGQLAAAALLLNLGARVDDAGIEGDTPLHDAAYAGHLEVARLLLAAGADISCYSHRWEQTPLQTATVRGHTEVAKLIQDEIDTYNQRYAARLRSPSALERLEALEQLEFVPAPFAGASSVVREAVEAMLRDPYVPIRYELVSVLESYGIAMYTNLWALSDDEDESVREHAGEALERLEPELRELERLERMGE